MLDAAEMPVLKLHGRNIDNVHHYNYLGVVVDDKLFCDDFIESKYNRLHFTVHNVGKMRKCI